jgi:hypothetical protein
MTGPESGAASVPWGGADECVGAIPGIATPSIVPFGRPWGACGAADGVGAAAAAACAGTAKPAPPSIVFWNPGFGAVDVAGASGAAGAGAGGAAEAAGGACIGAAADGAKPSIVFIGSLAAAGGAGACDGCTGWGWATAGAVDGARGVGSPPGGPNDGANPIIVLSGTLFPAPAVGAGPGAGAAGAAPEGSFTAPHWPQNLPPSGIGCPH